jgi:hypothetical protein
MVEHACFFLSQDNYTSGSIGKALKHRRTSFLKFSAGFYWLAYNFACLRREVKAATELEPQIWGRYSQKGALFRPKSLKNLEHPGVAEGIGLDRLEIEKFGNTCVIRT